MEEQKNNLETKKAQANVVKRILDYIILTLLRDKSKHGYELMDEIKKSFQVTIGASSMYPMLAKLEENELVTGTWNIINDHPRKIYSLTAKGEETLTYIRDFLTQLVKVC
ncbi:MAG: PadR family transcriptional regulator [Nitrososphaerota archaeon]|jgi:PadR family transcriptional regulator PadR|uniref:PadR family transcriptional regulator n=1 Tax=Candidatus Bathycorpusculum sp. TaxID=2994959 RepID=UPI002835D9FA|nr:PadR family transcriptional regulator [Candidatus Termiticorpusculum sp.]MCL2256737.1 PadR family transcriptional regulator [Candidatus Termiticorpusculum sp.]MCL2291560.1 PadR family transcriptional regulator [Candidatus Termiticorpusculum sp.]MDR0460032.1 PadR family transcriptional regulator [Nitrososphaerota archaeon]